MKSIETRTTPITIADVKEDDGRRTFWAKVLSYGVLDDHGTLFRQGCMRQGLESRLPKLMWGHGGWHDMSQLVGRGIDHRDGNDGLEVRFELDDPEAVPNSKQFWAQLKSGTIDQFSVGFMRIKDSRTKQDAGTWIDEARLGEVSGVVEGSVPGTKLLTMQGRSLVSSAAAAGNNWGLTVPRIHTPAAAGTRSMVDADVAARIMARFSLGECDLAEALAELKTAVHLEEAEVTPEGDDEGEGSDEDPPAPEGEKVPAVEEPPAEETPPVVDEDIAAAALAEANEVLAGRS